MRDRVRVRVGVRVGVNPKANLGHAARQAGVRGARGGEGRSVVGGGEQREGRLARVRVRVRVRARVRVRVRVVGGREQRERCLEQRLVKDRDIYIWQAPRVKTRV